MIHGIASPEDLHKWMSLVDELAAKGPTTVLDAVAHLEAQGLAKVPAMLVVKTWMTINGSEPSTS